MIRSFALLSFLGFLLGKFASIGSGSLSLLLLFVSLKLALSSTSLSSVSLHPLSLRYLARRFLNHTWQEKGYERILVVASALWFSSEDLQFQTNLVETRNEISKNIE